ncbi:UNVERIFIED_CONTAM: Retrovirus-related Pol polyprotein from transposon TNT 1-94 [Sesamum latifolium]|uniref:Retrovirus-related Pol polyprotein from transposon TNT 1-94 n=1 Tax=Sesamum latifolium TaxID=2727402 RepID=A0AAW2SIL2_9LAMI
MKSILIQQKVFKAISGTYPDNVTEEKIVEDDEIAYSSIILNLSDTVIRKVGTQNSAKELWKKLEELYTETSLPTKLFLLEKFFKYKLDVSKNIDKNINEFTKLIQDIKLTGDKSIDDYSPIVLLNAIPDTYNDVKSAIKYDRDSVNLKTVINGLKSKEIDLKANKPSQNNNEVNMVRGRTKNRNSKYKFRRHKNNDEVYMICDVNAVNSSVNINEWLVDSGCTFHMTPFKEVLTNYKSGKLGSVSMANEKLCDVHGYGDVCLSFENGFKLTLKNVRHVPDLCHNLMSCAALEEDGLEVMYLMVSTRPDIAYAVSCLSRFMSNAGTLHWEALKWLLRYLIKSENTGIRFSKCSEGVKLIGYVDSNYANDRDSRRSTTSYVFTLCGACISWKSQLQNIVALSTTEAEYIATTEAFKEAIWPKGILTEIGFLKNNVTGFSDSQSSIQLCKNPVFHDRTKHIEVRHHFIRDIVNKGVINLEKISSEENPADMGTKSFPIEKFQKCLNLLKLS